MATQTYQARYEKSYALVIGIDAYQHDVVPHLKTARFGAEAVAAVLERQYGFDEVVTLLDDEATWTNIADGYTALRAQTDPDDRFIVYFAGHGVGVEGRVRTEGWLLAHDSDHTRHHRMVRMADLVDPNYMTAKHALVILDSCHSGLAVTYEAPRAPSPPRDPRRALEHFLTRRAYQVIASANPYETATDAGLLEGHTPFTGYLLQALAGEDDAARDPVTGLLTAASAASYVRSNVAAFYRNWQGPQTGILPGDGGGVLVWQVLEAIDILPDRLRRGLTSEEPDTRYFAISEAAILLSNPRYTDAVRRVLEDLAAYDPDAGVRRKVLSALSQTMVPSRKEIQEPVEVAETDHPRPKTDVLGPIHSQEMRFTAEVDLSGRIEDTSQPTVMTLSAGLSESIWISGSDKERLIHVLRRRKPGWGSTRVNVYIFSTLLYLLLRNNIEKLDLIVIDQEYQGYEPLIKQRVMYLFRCHGLSVHRSRFSFERVNKETSNASLMASNVYKGLVKPDWIVTAEDVLAEVN